MVRTWLFAVFAVLFAVSGGCSSGSGETEFVELPEPAVVVTARESGETVPLRSGSCAKISLKENPSTGYLWSFRVVDDKGNDVENSCVELAGERFLPPDREVVGAPGIREAMVRGLRPGRGIVLGECMRPWERDKKPPIVTVRYFFEVSR